MKEVVLKNPIKKTIQSSIDATQQTLNFAVPFLNSFATTILTEDNTRHILDKRLLTRFDDSTLISFEIPTLLQLLELGFKIRFDNNIHLKLYITDDETFVSSSNLTQGGFESNIELTVKIDSENSKQCADIFNELWDNAKEKDITKELLNENWSKYEILKKREQYARKKATVNQLNINTVSEIDIEDIITEIFNLPRDIFISGERASKANESRKKFKTELSKGFKPDLFYVAPNHEKRRNNLFYEFSYGNEVSIASTGLRERQFKAAFLHPELKNVIEYIHPEMVGVKSWNFEDEDELLEFCRGIFDYEIPQYSEALPIRLASYFYPEYFLPIFNLDHLKKICEAMGMTTDVKTKGDRLFAYTSFTKKRMNTLVYDNNVKSNIAYNVMYTVEVYNRLKNGEHYAGIRSSYKENWKKDYLDFGLEILKKMNIVNE